MATAEITYTGGLRTQAVHTASGNTIISDAPVDNHGRGEAFSPTDLLAASLAQCMLTIIAIAGNTHGYDITGAKAQVTKVMASDPRRVGELHVEITLPPNGYTERERTIIERAAGHCPVKLSLHPDIKVITTYNY